MIVVVAALVSKRAMTGVGLEYVSRRMWTWAIGMGLAKETKAG